MQIGLAPEKIHNSPTEEICAVRGGGRKNVLGCPKVGGGRGDADLRLSKRLEDCKKLLLLI